MKPRLSQIIRSLAAILLCMELMFLWWPRPAASRADEMPSVEMARISQYSVQTLAEDSSSHVEAAEESEGIPDEQGPALGVALSLAAQPSPVPSASPSPAPEPTASPTATPTPSPSPSPAPPSPSLSPSPTPTPTPTSAAVALAVELVVPAAPPTPAAPIPAKAARALAWAKHELTSPDPSWSDQLRGPWSGYCEAFVEIAYNTRYHYASASLDYAAQRLSGRIHTDANPPAGALVYYGGLPHGHVALSVGGGQVISTWGLAGQRYPLRQTAVRAFTNPYLGWAEAPDNWPGY